jgi:hypothetical protein
MLLPTWRCNNRGVGANWWAFLARFSFISIQFFACTGTPAAAFDTSFILDDRHPWGFPNSSPIGRQRATLVSHSDANDFHIYSFYPECALLQATFASVIFAMVVWSPAFFLDVLWGIPVPVTPVTPIAPVIVTAAASTPDRISLDSHDIFHTSVIHGSCDELPSHTTDDFNLLFVLSTSGGFSNEVHARACAPGIGVTISSFSVLSSAWRYSLVNVSALPVDDPHFLPSQRTSFCGFVSCSNLLVVSSYILIQYPGCKRRLIIAHSLTIARETAKRTPFSIPTVFMLVVFCGTQSTLHTTLPHSLKLR